MATLDRIARELGDLRRENNGNEATIQRLRTGLNTVAGQLTGRVGSYLSAFDASPKHSARDYSDLEKLVQRTSHWLGMAPFVGRDSQELDATWSAEMRALQSRARKALASRAKAKHFKEVPPEKISDAALFEQLAHRYAYQDSVAGEDRLWLERMGYSWGGIQHGKLGADWVTFTPNDAGTRLGRQPVFAFRGTSGKGDLGADMGKNAVGLNQFNANIGAIAAGLAACGVRPVVTGHSLGGALAQLAACHLPSLVGRVVTFQAPGIDKASVEKLRRHNSGADAGERIKSQHHIASGDPVANAGYARTDGEIHEYGITGDINLTNSLMRLPGPLLPSELGYNIPKHLAYPVAESVRLGAGHHVRAGASTGGTGYFAKQYRTDSKSGKYTNAAQATSWSEYLRRKVGSGGKEWNRRHAQIQKALELLKKGATIEAATAGVERRDDIAQVRKAWQAIQQGRHQDGRSKMSVMRRSG